MSITSTIFFKMFVLRVNFDWPYSGMSIHTMVTKNLHNKFLELLEYKMGLELNVICSKV